MAKYPRWRDADGQILIGTTLLNVPEERDNLGQAEESARAILAEEPSIIDNVLYRCASRTDLDRIQKEEALIGYALRREEAEFDSRARTWQFRVTVLMRNKPRGAEMGASK